MNNCELQEYCLNKEGGYDCQCPNGHLGNGICIGVGSMIVFVILFGMYKLIKRRKETKKREHNFKTNGGLLLQQELSANNGAISRTKIFSRMELEKATDNFNNNRILGRGGQGTVYKGMLTDGTIVAVKKSKKVGENQLAQFINEVVILSHINHRNIVKLHGCCLETDVPLLVYEFVPNGTLYQHIHHPVEDFQMTWKVRFQIALECARAVVYLHSSCSSPIYHRDIKSSNILLDGKYKAKISDFGCSRSISIDKTHVTTCVQGTFGYLDPEFFRSSHFNDKSDVYSFGVVLLELITSKKPVFTNISSEPRGLATDFVQLMENSPHQLHGILDTQVLQHCSKEEIEALTKLIEQCLCLYGKQRPTMREVALTLEMIKSRHHKVVNDANEHEITRQEMHVWNDDNMSITKEDIYVDSSTDDSSYLMDF
ncbi:hypothetical protein V2J09_014180 [Rumex salicifolius]